MPRLENNVVNDSDVVKVLGRPNFLQANNAEGRPIIDEAYLGKRKSVLDWFYRNSFRASILDSLRGSGASPNNFIQSYILGGEELPETGVGNVVHSNVVQTTLVSELTPGKNEPLTGGNLEESGETLEQIPFTARFEGVRRRVPIIYPNYTSREAMQKILVHQTEVIWEAFQKVTRKEIERNLFSALTAGYDATEAGQMPLACRTVVGMSSKYKWASNQDFVTRLAQCYPVNVNTNGINPNFAMSTAHIRRLRDYARSNPYRALQMGEGCLQGGINTYQQRSRFILLIDTFAKEQLMRDEFYSNVYMRNARTLPENSLIDPIRFIGDYMGTVFDIDVFHCPQIDKYREDGILFPHLPSGLSLGIFLGASALVEGYGFTNFSSVTESRSGIITELVYEYVHGAAATRFPPYFSSEFRETDAVGNFITMSAGQKRIPNFPHLTYGMPEMGIMFSITCNKQLADWSDEEKGREAEPLIEGSGTSGSPSGSNP